MNDHFIWSARRRRVFLYKILALKFWNFLGHFSVRGQLSYNVQNLALIFGGGVKLTRR